MKITLKLDGINAVIEDGNVICSDSLLKNHLEDILSYEIQTPPQDGCLSFLNSYFEKVEIVSTDDDENLTY